MQSYTPYKQKYVHLCSRHGASEQLKSGKSNSIDDLLYNFKRSTPLLYKYIAFLFTCMLTHGVTLSDCPCLLSYLFLKIREQTNAAQIIIEL